MEPTTGINILIIKIIHALSQSYWHSNFCKVYDAALKYQNSDQVVFTWMYTKIVLAIMPLLVLAYATGHAYALTEADRYNSGYKQGVIDAGKLLSNMTGYNCNLNDHTVSFCHGYSAGYEARNDDNG